MLSFGNPHLDGDIQKIGLAMAAQRGSKYVRFGLRMAPNND